MSNTNSIAQAETNSPTVKNPVHIQAVTTDWNTNKQLTRNSKIMIVDDEDLVIRVVRQFLSRDGYTNFITITDPREALNAIRSEKPDVVLLDINMPHLSGCLLYTSPSPRDRQKSRMPSSA